MCRKYFQDRNVLAQHIMLPLSADVPTLSTMLTSYMLKLTQKYTTG